MTPSHAVIHLGPYKTGSSYLQQSWLSMPAEEESDLCLCHENLCYLKYSEAWTQWRPLLFRYASGKTGIEEAKEAFQRSFSGLPSRERLVISDEHLCFGPPGSKERGPDSAPEAPFWRLKAVCQGFDEILGPDCRFLVIIRAIPEYLESCYLNLLHNGRYLSLQSFKGRVRPLGFRWSSVLDPMAEAVGRERLSVYPFEMLASGQGALTRRIARDLDLPEPPVLPFVVNEGISGTLYRRYMAEAPSLSFEERRAFVQEMKGRYPRNGEDRPELFSERYAAAVRQASRDDSAYVFERYLPADLHKFLEAGYL